MNNSTNAVLNNWLDDVELNPGERIELVYEHNGKQYGGKYAVTSYGRFYSLPKRIPSRIDSDGSILSWRSIPGRWMALDNNNDGKGCIRVKVQPSDTTGVCRNPSIASLVLAHFAAPRKNPKFVAWHLTGNPLQNRIDDLAWVDQTTELTRTKDRSSVLKPAARKRLGLPATH